MISRKMISWVNEKQLAALHFVENVIPPQHLDLIREFDIAAVSSLGVRKVKIVLWEVVLPFPQPFVCWWRTG